MSALKLEINSAIWDLVERRNLEEASGTVIEYGIALPEHSCLYYDITTQRGRSEGFTGHTEQGDISVPDDIGEKTKTYTDKKERIGHFKMWRNGNRISFHHFWKSDTTTCVDDDQRPDTYTLVYDKNTCECLCFGVWRYKVLWSIRLLGLTLERRLYLMKKFYGSGSRPWHLEWAIHNRV